jgi:hypothetical protein
MFKFNSSDEARMYLAVRREFIRSRLKQIDIHSYMLWHNLLHAYRETMIFTKISEVKNEKTV